MTRTSSAPYLFAAAAALLPAIGASTSAQGPAETPLIPRQQLFGNPTRAAPRISPDGTQLSFLAPVDGVLNVWVAPADAQHKAAPVTRDRGVGIRSYFWAYTNEHIIYLQDDRGDENWRLFCVDLLTGEQLPLTPDSAISAGATEPHPVSARIQHISPKFPNEILVGLNDRDVRFHDLYRLSIDTGELIGVQFNDGFSRFHTDDDYTVRFAARLTPDGGTEIFRHGEDDDGQETWESWTRISMEDALTTGIVDFDKTGSQIYLIDSRGNETAVLKSLDLESGKSKVLAKDRDADISGGIMIHPTEKTVQAASSTFERKQWHMVDSSVKKDFKYLGGLGDGELEIISRSLDDSKWVVGLEFADAPARYYLYSRPTGSAELLFTNRPQLEDVELAPMHVQTIKARDKRKLVCYYTLPLAADPNRDGRPNYPVPMVLWVHGGPWARDYWGFEPVHQWLANRGYGVMSVNYRGSTGFGKKFLNAGNGEWGAAMHDDLVDAVEWAADGKLADRSKVAIMGGSYGGYAALVGLAMTPETFACGIDIVGPSNLVTFLESIPPYWQPLVDLWSTRVGNVRTEEGRSMLTERSPLTHAGKITHPLLLAHGANDPRVKQSDSDRIVEIMQGAGIPVTYVIYPDEGHGFSRPENRLSFYAVTEGFLAEHLGGRREPVGDDLARSSIQIPVGATHIAGATEGKR